MKIKSLIVLLLMMHAVGYAQRLDIELLKAKVLTEKGQMNHAHDIFLSLQQKFKTNAFFFKEWADSYYKEGDYELALKNYLIADSLRKNYTGYYISRCFSRLHELPKSILWLQQYLQLPEKLSELEITTDPAFSLMLNTDSWKALWKKSWYSDQEIEKNTVHALIKRKLYAEALDELEKYGKKYIPRHQFYGLQADILAHLEQINPALYAVEKAIALNGRIDAYYMLHASLNVQLKKYKDAVNEIAEAIKIDPYQAAYYLEQAKAAILAGELLLAVKDMNIINECYPDEPETLHQMALLEKTRGKYQNAMEYYNALIEKVKVNPEYFLERGQLAILTKSYFMADEDFGMALDMNPNLVEGYLQKGKVQLLLDNKTEACNNFRIAKKMGNAEASHLLYKNCGNE